MNLSFYNLLLNTAILSAPFSVNATTHSYEISGSQALADNDSTTTTTQYNSVRAYFPSTTGKLFPT